MYEEPEEFELEVLVTEREAERILTLIQDSDEGDRIGGAVRTVIGDEAFELTKLFDNVSLAKVVIPDAVGPGGELVCRIPLG